ncbi:MAG: pseudouridine synthase [Paludisphaera borealis]|uniref:pseudouridine synthase n=1 Tax=Paludisphaera borealis TaxID=1387353 RepID=UPI002844AD23|nr:pseudouridine synthase [Paludisphaera borealis]MDR3617970.1 pseudouridine synthase [Paludisphaera borealis]
MAFRRTSRQDGRPPRKSSGGPPGKPPGGYGKGKPARAAQGDRDQPRPNRPPGPGRPPGAHRPPAPGRPPGANRPPAPGRPPGPGRPQVANRPPAPGRPPGPQGPQRKPGRAPGGAEKGERLQKILAHAGLGSRRACEEYILQGRVTVDGKVMRELGSRVDSEHATIAVDGEKIKLETMVYYAVNKPKGYVSTNDDPAGRPRVVDLLSEVPERVYTVGRLDEESTGLMLLTNDGELANRLAHPRYGVEKIYRAVVAGMPSREVLTKLSEGIWLSEGKARVRRSRIVGMQGEATVLELVLAEGKNREIRRMLAKLGHKVMSLTRVAIGPIILKGLLVGEYRPLSRTEIDMLRKVAAGIAISPPRFIEQNRAFAPGRGRNPRPNQGAPGPRSRRGDGPEHDAEAQGPQGPRARVEREGPYQGPRSNQGPRPGQGARPNQGPRPPQGGRDRYEGPGRPGPGPGGPRSQQDRRPPHAAQGEHQRPGRPPGDRPKMPGRRPEGPGAQQQQPPGPGPISRARKGGGGSNVPPPLGLPPSKRRSAAEQSGPAPTDPSPRSGRKIIGLDPKITEHSSDSSSSSKLRKRPAAKRLPPRKVLGVKRHKAGDQE